MNEDLRDSLPVNDTKLTPDDLFTQQSAYFSQPEHLHQDVSVGIQCAGDDGSSHADDTKMRCSDSQDVNLENDNQDDPTTLDPIGPYDDIQKKARKWQCQLESELDDMYLLLLQNSMLPNRLAMIGAFDECDDNGLGSIQSPK